MILTHTIGLPHFLICFSHPLQLFWLTFLDMKSMTYHLALILGKLHTFQYHLVALAFRISLFGLLPLLSYLLLVPYATPWKDSLFKILNLLSIHLLLLHPVCPPGQLQQTHKLLLSIPLLLDYYLLTKSKEL